MVEPALPKALWFLAAYLSGVAGLGWMALAMEPHWQQLRGAQPLTRGVARSLRVLGTVGIALSLAICLRVDHASMAVLVWVMVLAAAALTVAFTLSWRPWLLAPLAGRVRWPRGRADDAAGG